MSDFVKNQIKTFCGWLVGIPILTLLVGASPLIVSTVLCVFYAVFYTFLDYALRGIQQYVKDKREKKHNEFWAGKY